MGSDPYFCRECQRTHYRGKIYKEHIKYKKKTDADIPDNRLYKMRGYTLKNLAKRQLTQLMKKYLRDKRSIYTKQMNKLLLKEVPECFLN